MGKLTFIIGGARSGKSRFAQELAKKAGGKVAFIATCTPGDKEMEKRIAFHKRVRPRSWKTIEEPRDIRSRLTGLKNKFDTVIIDCLGIFISNLLVEGLSESKIEKESTSMAKIFSDAKFDSIVVSNEVGEGIVPGNPLARTFRDMLGIANQAMAQYADSVFVMQAGIPVRIK